MKSTYLWQVIPALKRKGIITFVTVALPMLTSLAIMRTAYADPLSQPLPAPVEAASTNGQDTQSSMVATDGILTLTVTINKDILEGQPATLTMAIHNYGTKASGLGAFGQTPFSITINDNLGIPVSRTADGDRVLTPSRSVSSVRRIIINPGETCAYRFNIARMFDLTHAGDYSVSFSRYPAFGLPNASQSVIKINTPDVYSLRFTMVEDADSISGPTALTPSQEHQTFLYMVSPLGGSIGRYRVGSDESFFAVYNTPSPSITTGNYPSAIAATPDGRFLYVCNSGDNTVSQFRTGDNGNLTALSPPVLPAMSAPGFLLMDPKGQFLYAMSSGGGLRYTIGADGHITPFPQSRTVADPLHDLATPFAGAIDPVGRFMYICDGTTFGYRLGSDGTPTAFATPEFGTEHSRAWCDSAIAITPSGKFAYIGVSTTGRSYGFNLIMPMRIEANGVLTHLHKDETPHVPPLPSTGYHEVICRSMIIDPSGEHLIVLIEGYLDSYNIGKDGSLTLLGMTAAQGVSTLFFVPGGHILYALTNGSSSLSAFRFDHPFGGLSPVDVDLPGETPNAGSVTAGVAPTPQVWGPTAGGIAMSVSMPGDVYPTGRPLVMTVRLKNTTSHPIQLGTSGTDMSSFHLTLVGPKRQSPNVRTGPGELAEAPIPLLAAGDDVLNAHGKAGSALILPPGGERQYRFVLSRLADLSVAGYYTIQVARALPGKVTVIAPLQQVLLQGPFNGIVHNEPESILTVE
jgi:6-phosphogluconolactonase (cycloisomerase 2 family)